jgi:hypothetical protein
MSISNKPGISNWNNGRYRNAYTITQDVKSNQPVLSSPKTEEQPIEDTQKTQIEEFKPTKHKKQWENQNLTPPSGSETNI